MFTSRPPGVVLGGEGGPHPGGVPNSTTAAVARGPLRAVHLHRFRRTGDAPFSNGSLYACRCGVVRPAV